MHILGADSEVFPKSLYGCPNLKSKILASEKGKGGGETLLNANGLCVPWSVLDHACSSQLLLPGLLGSPPEVGLAGKGWEVVGPTYGGLSANAALI